MSNRPDLLGWLFRESSTVVVRMSESLSGYVVRGIDSDVWIEPVPCYAPVRASICTEVSRGWEAI